MEQVQRCERKRYVAEMLMVRRMPGVGYDAT